MTPQLSKIYFGILPSSAVLNQPEYIYIFYFNHKKTKSSFFLNPLSAAVFSKIVSILQGLSKL